MAFLVFFCSNFFLTLFASCITAYIAPAAAGSGIPEVKAYLNGVDAPGIYTLKTLVVKVKSASPVEVCLIGFMCLILIICFDCFPMLITINWYHLVFGVVEFLK